MPDWSQFRMERAQAKMQSNDDTKEFLRIYSGDTARNRILEQIYTEADRQIKDFGFIHSIAMSATWQAPDGVRVLDTPKVVKQITDDIKWAFGEFYQLAYLKDVSELGGLSDGKKIHVTVLHQAAVAPKCRLEVAVRYDPPIP